MEGRTNDCLMVFVVLLAQRMAEVLCTGFARFAVLIIDIVIAVLVIGITIRMIIQYDQV